jgi:hypothetical protein
LIAEKQKLGLADLFIFSQRDMLVCFRLIQLTGENSFLKIFLHTQKYEIDKINFVRSVNEGAIKLGQNR